MASILIVGCSELTELPEYNLPYKQVLVLGNSITIHGLTDYWWGEWGMAASKRENDFVHRLQDTLRSFYSNCTVTPVNIADWERSHTRYDLTGLSQYFISKPDLVIIRIGENVSSERNFYLSLRLLVNFIKSEAPDARIVITGVFWTDSSKDLTLRLVASVNNLTFIKLSTFNMAANKSSIGAVVYDEDGEPYSIDHPGVADHPNDLGMKAIADAIFSGIMQN